MKKLAVAVLMFLFLLPFYGCSPKAPERINLHIDASYSAEFEGIELQGLLIYTETGKMYLDISTPDELSSLSFSWDEGFTVGYHGLNAQTEEGYLPQSAFAEAVKNALDDLRLKDYALNPGENGLFFAECKNAYGEYEIFTDSNGYIEEIKHKDFTLNLNNQHKSVRSYRALFFLQKPKYVVIFNQYLC